jgi:hypothetical protein
LKEIEFLSLSNFFLNQSIFIFSHNFQILIGLVAQDQGFGAQVAGLVCCGGGGWVSSVGRGGAYSTCIKRSC